MEENKARRVVDALRARGTDADLARVGVRQFGVSIRLPDGREAVWDSDGTASLEAQVMRNGMLVGFVPEIEGSDSYTEDADHRRDPAHRLRQADRNPAYDGTAGSTGPADQGRALPAVHGRVPLPLSNTLTAKELHSAVLSPDWVDGAAAPARACVAATFSAPLRVSRFVAIKAPGITGTMRLAGWNS